MHDFFKKNRILSRGLAIFAIVIAIFTGVVLAATGTRNTVISMTSSDQATTTTWTGATTIDNVSENKETQYRVYEDAISGYSIDCTENAPCLLTRNGDNNYTATITNTASFKVITYDKNGGAGTDIADQRIDSTGNLATNNFTKADSAINWTVNFDANSGTSTGAPDNKLTATKTVSYTANGWNTKSDGTGTNYTNGSSITPASSMTMYAKYNESLSGGSVTLPSPSKNSTTSTIAVTFNAGDHGTSTGAPGDEISSTAQITWTPTGWWTNTAGGTKAGDAGESYTPAADDETLTRIRTEIRSMAQDKEVQNMLTQEMFERMDLKMRYKRPEITFNGGLSI